MFGRIKDYLTRVIPDKWYIKIKYYRIFGTKLNLSSPTLFNEKIQWLKLYDRRPEYAIMVDKYAVKQYVSNKIGSQYIIPTIGIWNSPDEINFNQLPHRYVLKTTHGGGGSAVIICKDAEHFDKKKAVDKLKSVMDINPYIRLREWPYKHVPHRIIAEEYIENEPGEDLLDYKFFCFNGEPKLCQIISDRRTEEKIDFYDMEWNRIIGLVGLNPKVKNSNYNHKRPKCFEEMKKIAAKLSEDITFSRIDLYCIKDKCYFGEITFYPAGGFGYFRPDKWNTIIGSWIKLKK